MVTIPSIVSVRPHTRAGKVGKRAPAAGVRIKNSAMKITLDDWIHCQFVLLGVEERARNHLENGPFSTAIHRQKPCSIDLFYR